MEGEQEKQGWYSDREMFEMIQGLTIELTETRTTIKKYNGLWEKFDKVDRRLTAIEPRAKWRASIFRGDHIREQVFGQRAHPWRHYITRRRWKNPRIHEQIQPPDWRSEVIHSI